MHSKSSANFVRIPCILSYLGILKQTDCLVSTLHRALSQQIYGRMTVLRPLQEKFCLTNKSDLKTNA